jgi:ketosteroid isomerase-like protein
VQWTIPVFSGFMVNSKVKEAVALEEKAKEDLESARRTAAQSARQAYLGVNNGLAQVSAYEAAEVSSQSSLASNQLGYQVGIRINIDVLNAQQQLYNTRQTLAKARYDTIVNGLRLKSASGSLKEDDLVAVNALLVHGIDTGATEATSMIGTPLEGTANTGAPGSTDNANANAQQEVLQTLEKWADAWSTRDVKGYLSFYSDDFQPAKGSRQAWEAQRSARISNRKDIKVDIESPRVSFAGDNKATVVFRQIYHSGSVKQDNKKTLLLAKRGDAWRIVRESSEN